jgi:hypothetical protein
VGEVATASASFLSFGFQPHGSRGHLLLQGGSRSTDQKVRKIVPQMPRIGLLDVAEFTLGARR